MGGGGQSWEEGVLGINSPLFQLQTTAALSLSISLSLSHTASYTTTALSGSLGPQAHSLRQSVMLTMLGVCVRVCECCPPYHFHAGFTLVVPESPASMPTLSVVFLRCATTAAAWCCCKFCETDKRKSVFLITVDLI